VLLTESPSPPNYWLFLGAGVLGLVGYFGWLALDGIGVRVTRLNKRRGLAKLLVIRDVIPLIPLIASIGLALVGLLGVLGLKLLD
jgi:hypothetical protein